jgi:hypothetical protein
MERISNINNFSSQWCYKVVQFNNPHNISSNIKMLHLDDNVYYNGEIYDTIDYFVEINKFGNTWLDIWRCVDELYKQRIDTSYQIFKGFKEYNEDTLTIY